MGVGQHQAPLRVDEGAAAGPGERGPLAVRAVKVLVDAALGWPLAEGHAAEVAASVRIFATDDLLEGARSFVEKRSPTYHGR